MMKNRIVYDNYFKTDQPLFYPEKLTLGIETEAY